jgi:hypothetical protein
MTVVTTSHGAPRVADLDRRAAMLSKARTIPEPVPRNWLSYQSDHGADRCLDRTGGHFSDTGGALRGYGSDRSGRLDRLPLTVRPSGMARKPVYLTADPGEKSAHPSCERIAVTGEGGDPRDEGPLPREMVSANRSLASLYIRASGKVSGTVPAPRTSTEPSRRPFDTRSIAGVA